MALAEEREESFGAFHGTITGAPSEYAFKDIDLSDYIDDDKPVTPAIIEDDVDEHGVVFDEDEEERFRAEE